ncbi:MAG TPA: bifunctional UDP-4-keto-pentose/UDP-xylose synthase, partial [Thermoanaerobaculia bacterium]|nr:bifunctional UDP-4-keto-pentose/UDP-xylose synthase [Thermoanaerobaculia bacterium]
HPGFGEKARETPIMNVSSMDYYGEGYQDILTRVPSIGRAREILGWEPRVDLDEALRLTVDFYLSKRPVRA